MLAPRPAILGRSESRAPVIEDKGVWALEVRLSPSSSAKADIPQPPLGAMSGSSQQLFLLSSPSLVSTRRHVDRALVPIQPGLGLPVVDEATHREAIDDQIAAGHAVESGAFEERRKVIRVDGDHDVES